MAEKPKFNQLAYHYLALGLIVVLAAGGAVLTFRFRPDYVTGHPRLLLGLSVLWLIAGMRYAGLGLKRQFRTTEVIDATAPLAEVQDPNKPRSLDQSRYTPFPDMAKRLKDMMDMQRPEMRSPPNNLIDRWLWQSFHELQYASAELQNEAVKYFQRAARAAVVVTLFAVLALSIAIGTFGEHAVPVVGWTALAYFCCLALLNARKTTHVGVLLAVALLIPALIGLIHSLRPLPSAPAWAFVVLFLAFALPIAQIGEFFYFLRKRTGRIVPHYESSRKEVRIQHTIHPVALFQYFCSIMDRRRLDLKPNRCYRYQRDHGNTEVNRTGSFSGEMLWETHADFQKYEGQNTSVLGWAGVALTVMGFLGALCAVGLATGGFGFFLAALLLIHGGIGILQIAEKFSLECTFSSKLVAFDVAGTWARATVAAGNRGRGPLYSENEEDKVDARVTVLLADVVTSVFAKPGTPMPFQNQPRSLTTFSSDEQLLEDVLIDLEKLLMHKTNVSEIRLPDMAPEHSSIFARIEASERNKKLPSISAGSNGE